MADGEPLPGPTEPVPEPARPARRRWWVLVVVAVLAAGAGVLGTNLLNRSSEPEPTATSTGPTEPTTTESGPEYVVEAGGGGTTVADVDGVTPMGYEQTCEGGIAAATNQWMAVSAQPDGWWTEDGLARFNEVLAYFSPGDQNLDWAGQYSAERAAAASAMVEYAEDYDSPYYYTEDIAAAGVFRVASCTRSEVVVDLIYGTERTVLQEPELTEYLYSSIRVTVRWLDDWSIREAEPIPDDGSPARAVQPEGDETFSADLRDELLAAGGPEWMEYSNAQP